MAQNPQNAPVGLAYAHINTATTTVVKAAPGLLNSLNIGSAASGATITFYDNTSAAAPIMHVVTLGAAETLPQQIPMGWNYKTGLTIVTTGTLDITVAYR